MNSPFNLAGAPRILTTTVGSYPAPDWLLASPSEQARLDATRVVLDIQRQAGIDLPTDGELCRFNVNHPESNGMIDYFVSTMSGTRTTIGRQDWIAFTGQSWMKYRRKPAAVVTGPLGEGGLNLYADCAQAAGLAKGPYKFTVTSPYMLARALVDNYYNNFEALTMALAQVLAAQVADLPCACVQIDEANITGTPHSGPLGARAMNLVLNQIKTERAIHLCFGNYAGQTIQQGHWRLLIDFINALQVHHVVLELAHRPAQDLDALRAIRPEVLIGVGVIDVKVNPVETPDEVARRIEAAEHKLGEGRVRWVHPDCGLWMLRRPVADRKLEALVLGRNKYLGL